MTTWANAGLTNAALTGALLGLGLVAPPAGATGGPANASPEGRRRPEREEPTADAAATGHLPRYADAYPPASPSDPAANLTDGFLAGSVTALASATPAGWDAAATAIGPWGEPTRLTPMPQASPLLADLPEPKASPEGSSGRPAADNPRPRGALAGEPVGAGARAHGSGYGGYLPAGYGSSPIGYPEPSAPAGSTDLYAAPPAPAGPEGHPGPQAGLTAPPAAQTSGHATPAAAPVGLAPPAEPSASAFAPAEQSASAFAPAPAFAEPSVAAQPPAFPEPAAFAPAPAYAGPSAFAGAPAFAEPGRYAAPAAPERAGYPGLDDDPLGTGSLDRSRLEPALLEPARSEPVAAPPATPGGLPSLAELTGFAVPSVGPDPGTGSVSHLPAAGFEPPAAVAPAPTGFEAPAAPDRPIGFEAAGLDRPTGFERPAGLDPSAGFDPPAGPARPGPATDTDPPAAAGRPAEAERPAGPRMGTDPLTGTGPLPVVGSGDGPALGSLDSSSLFEALNRRTG
jgi:hypothetical protein